MIRSVKESHKYTLRDVHRMKPVRKENAWKQNEVQKCQKLFLKTQKDQCLESFPVFHLEVRMFPTTTVVSSRQTNRSNIRQKYQQNIWYWRRFKENLSTGAGCVVKFVHIWMLVPLVLLCCCWVVFGDCGGSFCLLLVVFPVPTAVVVVVVAAVVAKNQFLAWKWIRFWFRLTNFNKILPLQLLFAETV